MLYREKKRFRDARTHLKHYVRTAVLGSQVVVLVLLVLLVLHLLIIFSSTYLLSKEDIVVGLV